MARDAPAFVDTSVIVRYLIGDPPGMAETAREIVDSEAPLAIPCVVLLEAAHVLASVYHAAREDLIDALIGLVQKRNVTVVEVDERLLVEGLHMCRPSGRVSVGDAIIWAVARSSGANVIYSFDRRFAIQDIEVRRTL